MKIATKSKTRQTHRHNSSTQTTLRSNVANTKEIPIVQSFVCRARSVCVYTINESSQKIDSAISVIVHAKTTIKMPNARLTLSGRLTVNVVGFCYIALNWVASQPLHVCLCSFVSYEHYSASSFIRICLHWKWFINWAQMIGNFSFRSSRPNVGWNQTIKPIAQKIKVKVFCVNGATLIVIIWCWFTWTALRREPTEWWYSILRCMWNVNTSNSICVASETNAWQVLVVISGHSDISRPLLRKKTGLLFGIWIWKRNVCQWRLPWWLMSMQMCAIVRVRARFRSTEHYVLILFCAIHDCT